MLPVCQRLVARFRRDDLIYNHIFLRLLVHHGRLLISPYGMLFEEVTAPSLVAIDLEGRRVGRSPYPLNVVGFVRAAIRPVRPDVTCVRHTHFKVPTATSLQPHGLLPIIQFAMQFLWRQSVDVNEGVALDLKEQPRLAAELRDGYSYALAQPRAFDHV